MSGVPVASAGAQQRMITLSELKVFELKQELEKRGLDKNGIKFALIERLETALREDGHDPKTYLFAVGDYNKNSSTNKTSSSKRNSVGEEVLENVDEKKEPEDAEKSVRQENENDEEVTNHGLEDTEEPQSLEQEEERKMTVDETNKDINCRKVDRSNKRDDTERETDVEMVESGAKKPSENEKPTKEAHVKQQKIESVESKAAATKQRDSLDHSIETSASTPSITVEKSSSTHSQTSSKKPADNSLWIKGISPSTKAADLKALFSKYGRVITAKIFTRRQQPSSACFGFVTMVDSATADVCIHKLHKTTLKGRVITVERADRSNMPVVKSVTKKTTASVGSTQKSTSTSANGERPKSEERAKGSRELSSEKEKKERSSAGKVKSTATVEKAGSHSGSDKQKTVKAASSSSKKVPIRAPSTNAPQVKSRPSIRERVQSSRFPPTFRAGRRVLDRPERFGPLRHTFGGPARKPGFLSNARRPIGGPPGRPLMSARLGGRVNRFARREVSSRRVESLTAWDKREMMEMLRKKEEEHRLKEQELRLQRERERLKFERERFERERLELQQLRQLNQFVAPQIPIIPPARRSHESYDEGHSSSRHRGEYSRSSGERNSTTHRSSTSSSSRAIAAERREPRVSSRHVSSSHHVSSRDTAERERSRHSGRERDSRDYGSSSSRDPYSRDSHSSYGRTADTSVASFGKDVYRGAEIPYSSTHRSGDLGYTSREIGYSSDNFGSSSRSAGASAWPVSGGGSSAFMASSSGRDYDASGSWMASAPSSSSQSHGVGAGQWQSSRAVDNWSSGDAYAPQASHGSSYERSYDKYDSYDKYPRRY